MSVGEMSPWLLKAIQTGRSNGVSKDDTTRNSSLLLLFVVRLTLKATPWEGGEYRVCFCTEAGSEEPCNSQNPHRFTTDAGTLTIKGPRPAHAPWALQFGGEGNDTATHVLVDSAKPEKGLGHALVAGTTSGTIVNPKTTRGIAEASMTWTEGRSDSDYIATDCGLATNGVVGFFCSLHIDLAN